MIRGFPVFTKCAAHGRKEIRKKRKACMRIWEKQESATLTYQARLRDLGALDFDDLLTEGLKRDVTGLRCFRHVLVDEFQDINDIQYQLVRS